MLLLAASLLAQPESQDKPSENSNSTTKPSVVVLQPDANGNVAPEQIRALLQQAEEKDIENDKRGRDYTYIQHVVRHELDHDGGTKKTETFTSEILEIYGEDVERRIEKDDKPLPADEAKKQEEKIQKIIDKRKNESEEERQKRLAKEEKEREEDRKFVLEIADAYNFRLVGSEAVDGRDAWVLEGEPRPGYQPKDRNAKFLSKFEGRVWIDKQEGQWVKLDITAIDTVSVGWVLARIHKGSHLVVQMTRVNDEVWLPKYLNLRLDARIALFKGYNDDVEQTYRDYKKFRADTKITVMGETQ
jgi:hypothetical protein